MNEMERNLEAKCMRLVRASGGQHRKLDVGPGAKGWFDQAVWLPNGRHFLVEFKVGRNRPKGLQKSRIETFNALGFAVYVVCSYEYFERILGVS